MSSRNLPALALASSIGLLAACGGGGGGGASTGPVGTKGWTVLVYMTADNNLEADGLRDLIEMASVGSGDDLRYVVQADRAVGEYSGGVLNLGDWTSTKRLLVRKNQLQELADLGEVDMGLSSTLADFVSWGVKTYPGERYMLVFWDHGGGWKGFGWDDSHPLGSGEPDHLTLDRIAAGVSQGLSGTSLARFDIIGFDACLMATLEVAESVKPYASYLLASEEVEPGHGWDWAAFGGGGLLDPRALGTKVIDGFMAQARAAPWKDSADVTLSLVDLSKLGPIETALTGLAGTYGTASAVAPVLSQVAAGRRSAMEYAANPDPSRAYALVDLVDLFGGMSGVSGASTLQSAVSGAVVYSVAGTAKVGSHGLSIYFPTDSGLYNPAYDALPGMGAWRTFLNALFGGGAAEVVPKFTPGTGAYDRQASGLTLSGAVTASAAAAVSKSYLAYGLPDGGSGAYLLGDAPATSSGGVVTGEWQWDYLQVVQGTHKEYGYLALEVVSSSQVAASIPLAYDEQPGVKALQFALWRIVFDVSGTSIAVASNNVFLYSGGGVAELNAASGSKLRALVSHVPDLGTWSSSWELSDGTGSPGFDATQPLDLDIPTFPAGTSIAAVLRIENTAGEGDWLYVPPPTVTIP
jgi:hypothetical protein